jgi:hypothetical protein
VEKAALRVLKTLIHPDAENVIENLKLRVVRRLVWAMFGINLRTEKIAASGVPGRFFPPISLESFL